MIEFVFTKTYPPGAADLRRQLEQVIFDHFKAVSGELTRHKVGVTPAMIKARMLRAFDETAKLRDQILAIENLATITLKIDGAAPGEFYIDPAMKAGSPICPHTGARCDRGCDEDSMCIGAAPEQPAQPD